MGVYMTDPNQELSNLSINVDVCNNPNVFKALKRI